MSTIKLEAGTIQTLLDTELNSLANNDAALDSAEYDNATNLYEFAAFELYVDFVSAPTAGPTIELYMIPSLDGTNYGDGDGTPLAQINTFVGAFDVRATTAAMRLNLAIPSAMGAPNLAPLLPVKYKALIYNKSGQAFPASGSTLKMLPYRRQVV